MIVTPKTVRFRFAPRFWIRSLNGSEYRRQEINGVKTAGGAHCLLRISERRSSFSTAVARKTRELTGRALAARERGGGWGGVQRGDNS